MKWKSSSKELNVELYVDGYLKTGTKWGVEIATHVKDGWICFGVV